MQELAKRFPDIPQGAKTFEQLQAEFPTIPESPMAKWLAKRIQSGEWKKARRGTATFYWPAEAK